MHPCEIFSRRKMSVSLEVIQFLRNNLQLFFRDVINFRHHQTKITDRTKMNLWHKIFINVQLFHLKFGNLTT